MSRADGGDSTGGSGPPSDTAETHTGADLLEESSGDSWTHLESPAREDLPVLYKCKHVFVIQYTKRAMEGVHCGI